MAYNPRTRGMIYDHVNECAYYKSQHYGGVYVALCDYGCELIERPTLKDIRAEIRLHHNEHKGQLRFNRPPVETLPPDSPPPF